MKIFMLTSLLMIFFCMELFTQTNPNQKLKEDNLHESTPGTGENFSDFDSLLYQQAGNLADNLLIIDCHSHDLFKYYPSVNNLQKQLTLNSLKSGSVKGLVQSFPVNLYHESSVSENILNDIKAVKNEILNGTDKISMVLNSHDLLQQSAGGKILIITGIESFNGLSEGNLELLQNYYREGVRIIGLSNSGADTIFVDDRLTEYGKDFIRELNRLGIMCDITHIRRSVQNQIIKLSVAPVIISHGGASGAVGSKFNTPDSILQMLAANGGMIGITFYSGQISSKSLSEQENGVEWNKITRATVNELIDHIDYLKNMIGIDHIGIGTDYGGSGKQSPSGLETIEGFPVIIYHMLKRGYTESEIKKVMGLNFLNLWQKVESNSLSY